MKINVKKKEPISTIYKLLRKPEEEKQITFFCS